MNKKDFEANLKKAIGQTEYGDEVVADLVEHYESTGKYAQNICGHEQGPVSAGHGCV